MFWGLILEPNKRYSQTVEKSFHVSMASLNLSTADENVVQVMLYYENSSYLLCNLNKSSTWQVPLDLNFQEGTTIAFICHGHGQVHLTGYLIPDEDLDLDELEDEEEEEEDDEAPQLVDKQSKRKAMDSLEKNVKRLKQEIEAESSDEEVELDGTNEENDSEESEEEDEEILNEEEDSDDIEEEEEDEEDDVDEEQEKKTKAQQKAKKNKEQKKKEEKKKLVNGSEVKQKKNKEEHQQNQKNIQSEQKKRVAEGGVQIEELKLGTGAPAKSGKFVSVYYVGRLKNGKKFDSTTHGDGFKFRLGKGEVIRGWDIGIVGMKMGGKRRITIPPAMAYGAKGSPPVIPGNSTLIFEVELRNIH